ncbi:type VI secretion system-associated protein TagO [Alkalilimnicola sp. S0819]|uniref:type VI secretion system-associated protein TagO n=1 Tax=Alkalilimnicola sp. S0819 TaxID=2613922 RepID=UPI001261E9A6|nr:type VI secretion system-associated protein TagO [Alkalilimnicola sp. S0819]KAB7619428.1 hypothetical protein F3N43_13805 [Alkalilimnicola sp. S0819]MPQ17712.1 hypothetical protein [Alkalilimnicola sp. S0819]
MRRTLFFLLLPLYVPAAHASVEKEIAKCAAENGDLARLACFDAIAEKRGLAGPQAQPTNVSGTGKWQVSAKTNPVDDSKTVTLVLKADSGQSRWGRPVAIIARCQSNKTELYISWNDYLGSSASVLTRIGSNKAITKSWSLSTDSQATFHPRGTISFIKEMMSANKLVAQVTPYNESPVTAIFDTSGLENAIKPLRETCNW